MFNKHMDEMQRKIDCEARAFAFNFGGYVACGIVVVQLIGGFMYGVPIDQRVPIVLCALVSSYSFRKLVLERRALAGSEDEPRPVWPMVAGSFLLGIVVLLLGVLLLFTPMFL